MKETNEKQTGLPENAFRPLKPGEQYHPLMSPDKNYPEVNLWSVLWGIAWRYFSLPPQLIWD